ncbi:nucleotide-diphospho-sugar transferase [Cristinia sonorae]|uniref:Nucleotide-diphospho-sugar transferase n=1 Tax=Cristinia sonorae TaxID=1940300 RepID=A0A8K0UH89_9AGAR|nr:nucleotide-diphospho-sugar transferase [Cristinia sonorae]
MFLLSYFTRPKDYVQLPHRDALPSPPLQYPHKRAIGRRHVVVILLVLLISVVLNIVLFVKPMTYPQWTALDNYQSLNHNPIVEPTVLPLLTANEQPEHFHDHHAVVTSLYSDDFAGGVATLGHSLRQANTTARLIVIYIPDQVSPAALCLATSTGFFPHPVKRIPPPHDGQGVYAHFLDQFTKLNVWTLDQIGVRSLVYLDADTLVKRNFDELFALPFVFGAVPDVYIGKLGYALQFNAGVLFLHTSTEVFNDMVSKLTTAHYPLVDAEQSFLNHYFGAEAVRLPYHYNVNLAIKYRSQALWDGTASEHRVIHYTLVKPFIGRGPTYTPVKYEHLEWFTAQTATEDNGIFKEEMLWWRKVFRDMKRTYGDAQSKCLASGIGSL